MFVSSTYKDLADFRMSVAKAVRQLGGTDISMENFGARDERPKDVCLNLISTQSDVFVGIYAHRYGYIPDGEVVSITEAEYDAASTANIPRLIYLVDDATPWVPANVDRRAAGAKLRKFKNRLKANHICEFFSTKDDLATKVAADLGRHLSKLTSNRDKSPPADKVDPDREARLIRDLKSSNSYEVKRSILALSETQSPWLVGRLAEFVVGKDKEIADVAISALRKIPGVESAKAIAGGLGSDFSSIRSMAVFTLGEMALFGRRHDAQSILDQLMDALANPTEDLRVLEELVHTLGKTGGKPASRALIEILKSNGMPPRLKARALHGPGRFWRAVEYEAFVTAATGIVKQWSVETCEEVSRTDVFPYVKNPLKELVLSHSLDRP